MNRRKINSGSIVLCGGKSTRMGVSKASLPFGPELMLQRVVRLVSPQVDRIAVVAAPGQDLPELPPDVIVARDLRVGRGPLEGLYAGLLALPEDVELVYATSCDVPLLAAGFVKYLFDRIGDDEVAVPFDGRFHHPLSAVYRRSVVDTIQQLLEQNQLRPVHLYDLVRTQRVPLSDLQAVDPQLQTLKNLNHPHEYRAALSAAQIVLTPDLEALLKSLPNAP